MAGPGIAPRDVMVLGAWCLGAWCLVLVRGVDGRSARLHPNRQPTVSTNTCVHLPWEAPFALLVQVSFSCRSAVLLLDQRRSASHDCRGCDMFSTLFPHPALFMRVTTAL